MKTEILFEMTGTTPVRTHSAALVDPMDPYTRELKPLLKKRTKTEADDEQMAFLEARGSMYVEDGKLVMPERNIKAMMSDAAKSKRLGTTCKKNLQVSRTTFTFSGPQDPDERAKDAEYRDRRVVSANPGSSSGTKTIRTRPLFDDWAVTGKLVFPTGILDVTDLKEIMMLAGISGCCERWDGFGQFEVTKWEVVS